MVSEGTFTSILAQQKPDFQKGFEKKERFCKSANRESVLSRVTLVRNLLHNDMHLCTALTIDNDQC